MKNIFGMIISALVMIFIIVFMNNDSMNIILFLIAVPVLFAFHYFFAKLILELLYMRKKYKQWEERENED